MTEIEVATMLDMIKDCHQNFNITDSTIKTWYMLFADYECEPLMASARKYLRTNEYCPVPASILKLYEEGKSKLNQAVGHDVEELMSVLTFMCQRSDVCNEVEYYRQWIKTVPEMVRMKVSANTLARLKEYGNKHVGEYFDFIEWLKKQNESGE